MIYFRLDSDISNAKITFKIITSERKLPTLAVSLDKSNIQCWCPLYIRDIINTVSYQKDISFHTAFFKTLTYSDKI